MLPNRNVLLQGIVGSTAYGLAGPSSDVDRLGVFAYPTMSLLGLHRLEDSYVTTSPDRTMHEAAKYCRLALGCNPTVMELLWLPEDLYEDRTDLGEALIEIRTSFLSAKRVRDAYLGYASQQFHRLESRGDGSFSADTRKRTAKHARHLYRLLYQGFQLYHTGKLVIRLSEGVALNIHLFGEDVASGDTVRANELLGFYEANFDAVTTSLPSSPDEEKVEKWLLWVRGQFYRPEHATHIDHADQ